MHHDTDTPHNRPTDLHTALLPNFPPDPIPTILVGAGINLLAGAPNVGKTALLAGIMTRFRDGLPIFGHPSITPTKLAVLCIDRSWPQTTRVWFERAGYADIPAYSLLDDDEFVAKRLRKKQDRMIVFDMCLERLDLPFGALVMVDPIATFFGGNINDYDSCMVACMEMRQTCRRRGITLIGAAHAGKQKADKAQRYIRLQDRIAGSTALFGFTDTQMYLGSPEEIGEKFYILNWNPHLAPSESFKLTRDDLGLFIPHGPLEQPISTLDNTAWADGLLGCIAVAPDLTPVKDLIDHLGQLGISRRTLYRQIDALIDLKQVIRVGHGKICRPRPT